MSPTPFNPQLQWRGLQVHAVQGAPLLPHRPRRHSRRALSARQGQDRQAPRLKLSSPSGVCLVSGSLPSSLPLPPTHTHAPPSEIWQKWTNNGGSGASDGTPLLYTRPPALSVVDMPTVPCDPAVCKVQPPAVTLPRPVLPARPPRQASPPFRLPAALFPHSCPTATAVR